MLQLPRFEEPLQRGRSGVIGDDVQLDGGASVVQERLDQQRHAVQLRVTQATNADVHDLRASEQHIQVNSIESILQRFTYIALSSIVAARELAHVLKRQRLVQPEALIVATERETFVQD